MGAIERFHAAVAEKPGNQERECRSSVVVVLGCSYAAIHVIANELSAAFVTLHR